MRMIFSLLIIFLVSSCTLYKAETPSQRYYALKSLYKDILSAAVIYKEDCDIQPLVNDCHNYVKEIQSLNNYAREAFKSADYAGAKTNSNVKQEVITGVDVAVGQMYLFMLDIGAMNDE